MNYEGPWLMNDAARDTKYQYNGKEMNDDFGLNWNDYGARWYDAAIGRFSVKDRFAEKYSEMSPYQYGANNPVKFIDVNGDSIVIRVGKDAAYYNDGKLTNRDGTAYSGKGTKIDKDGSLKLTGFLKETVKALDRIRTGGETGNGIVSTLQRDNDRFFISEGKNGNVGRTVKFDPNNTEGGPDNNGNTRRPAFIGLAHELTHALDWDDGSVDSNPWINYSDGSQSSYAEQYASHIENLVRAENGVALREFYGTDLGKGVGRLIIQGTRASSHFFREFNFPDSAVNIRIPVIY
jgi:RHS repeat-associated protein